MILHRLRDWLRPERIVDSMSVSGTGYVGVDHTAVSRIAFNEADERIYVYDRRWRWSR